MQHRRAFLAAVGAVGSHATAGCSSRATARISGLTILNTAEETAQLAVEITKDGSVVFDRTITVPPEDGPVFDEPWMDTPGRFEFTVESSTTDNVLERTVPQEQLGPGCYAVIVRVRPDGFVDLPVDSASTECETPTEGSTDPQ